MNSKVCTGCKVEKDFSEFYPQPTGKFGYNSKCKKCINQSPRIEKECITCKNTFTGTPKKKWCSDECKKQYQKEKASREYQENKEESLAKSKAWFESKRDIEKTCEYCEKTFLTYREDARFCDNSCATSWRNKNGLGAGTHRMKEAGERFEKLVKENGHILLSKYEGGRKSVLIDVGCKVHEPMWKNAKDYQDGYTGCPDCSRSKGEAEIEKEIIRLGLVFESEYTFPSTSWRYDFILPLENTIIEVHGAQHYEESKHFDRTLKEEQENDRQKKEYAESLGYKYIVVDYREHKPKLALERFRKEFKTCA